jgi:hypothetical protein
MIFRRLFETADLSRSANDHNEFGSQMLRCGMNRRHLQHIPFNYAALSNPRSEASSNATRSFNYDLW